MDVSPEAVVVFGVLFVVVLVVAWWARSRRKPARRLPYQSDIDDFTKIFRF